MLRSSLFLTCAAVAAALPALATEAAMNQALSAWNGRMQEYKAAVEQAPTAEAKAAVAQPDGADIAPALWQSVSGVTKSRQEEGRNKKGEKELRTVHSYEFEQAWAAPAVVWFINHPAALSAAIGSDKPKQRKATADALMKAFNKQHFSAPCAAEVCATLSSGTSVDEYDTLEKIYNNNQDNNARACAALGMSLMLSNPMVSGVAGSELMARGKRIYYLKQALLLSKDDTDFGGAPLTEVAREQAYRLRHLAVGSVPPQMTLRDAQGKENVFPRPGKTHLIFFWSPQESVGSDLVKKLPGIQARYPDLEICPVTPALSEEEQAALAEEPIGLPSYTDDAQGSAGHAYRISVVPTAVLLSPNSTILYIGYPDMRLQTALASAFPQQERKGSIMIKDGSEEAPVLQPGSAPKAPQQTEASPSADTPPDLREIPNFNE